MDIQKKTNTITASQLQREVGTVLRRVGQGQEHLIVERDGFPVVAIIPVVEYGLLMQSQKAEK